MNLFNELNGIPATGNKHLQRDILKGIGNLMDSSFLTNVETPHGYAKDSKASC
jgi:beta-glucosidase